MKIAQFVNNLDMGGLERLAVDLAQCQVADGHEAFIYCLTHPGRLAKEAAEMDISVRSFTKGSGPRPGVMWKIATQLRDDRIDVLHTHNHLVHHYGVVAGQLAAVPVIVNTRHRAECRLVCGADGSHITAESPDKKSDLIFRATLPWVGAAVFISESTRQFFVKYRGVPASKTQVILNGAHLERFLSVPSHPGSVPGRVRFGIAARLVPEKDHFTLLRAFSRVVSEIPGAELQIAGDGPLWGRLIDFAQELKLTGHVTFLGALPHTAQFLSQLDIFVLSSLNEGLPLVLLEAMAAGLPIVSTRAGGVEEAAVDGKNAWLADPGDANGLAQAMIRMARTADPADVGAIGRKMVQERFRIEQTWQEYHELFLKLGANP
ncbi:MAG: glycosyltransferase [Terracidiphilus sp.]|jgi:glycosyltransferase involved in cell wall biosynthesis